MSRIYLFPNSHPPDYKYPTTPFQLEIRIKRILGDRIAPPITQRFLNICEWVRQNDIKCHIVRDTESVSDQNLTLSQAFISFENDEDAIECALRFGTDDEARSFIYV